MSEPQPEHDAFHDAFLSYSTAADERFSARLEEYLEGFHRLAWVRALKLRALRICRDNSDFGPAAPAPEGTTDAPLEATVKEELRRSRFLIVLCSPASVRSFWVGREIRFFAGIDDGRKSRILLAVTQARDTGVDPRLVFPPAVIELGLHESQWHDLRAWAHPIKHRFWKRVRQREEPRRLLVARLLQKTPAELEAPWQREARRLTRNRRVLGAGLLAVVTGAIASTIGTAWEVDEFGSREVSATGTTIVQVAIDGHVLTLPIDRFDDKVIARWEQRPRRPQEISGAWISYPGNLRFVVFPKAVLEPSTWTKYDLGEEVNPPTFRGAEGLGTDHGGHIVFDAKGEVGYLPVGEDLHVYDFKRRTRIGVLSQTDLPFNSTPWLSRDLSRLVAVEAIDQGVNARTRYSLVLWKQDAAGSFARVGVVAASEDNPFIGSFAVDEAQDRIAILDAYPLTRDRSVRLRMASLSTRKEIASVRLDTIGHSYDRVAFTPVGEVALGSWNLRGGVESFRTETLLSASLKPLLEIDGGTVLGATVTIWDTTPDENAAPDVASLWNLATGTRSEVPGFSLGSLAASRDGRFWVNATSRRGRARPSLEVWSAGQKKLLTKVPLDGEPRELVVAADDQSVLVAADAGKALVYSLPDLQILAHLEGAIEPGAFVFDADCKAVHFWSKDGRVLRYQQTSRVLWFSWPSRCFDWFDD